MQLKPQLKLRSMRARVINSTLQLQFPRKKEQRTITLSQWVAVARWAMQPLRPNSFSSVLLLPLYTAEDNWPLGGLHYGINNGPNGYHNWAGNTPIQLLVDDYEMMDGSKFNWSNPAQKHILMWAVTHASCNHPL